MALQPIFGLTSNIFYNKEIGTIPNFRIAALLESESRLFWIRIHYSLGIGITIKFEKLGPLPQCQLSRQYKLT